MEKDTYYESEYKFDARRRTVWKEIVRYLSPHIPADGVVVDLGAGYCDFINLVAAGKRYAVDVSPELSQNAGEGVTPVNAPAWDLSAIADSSVDIVHASNLLEHFTDDELSKVMGETKRVLKPGGKIMLMQPNYRLAYKTYFDDPTHKKAFSDVALEVFLGIHGFRVLLRKPRFLPFSMRSNPGIIPGFLLPIVVRAYIHSPIKPFAGQMLFVAEKSGE